MDYYQHFKNEEASDFPLYRGNSNQRGLGNWFRSFFRFIVPILKKHAVPENMLYVKLFHMCFVMIKLFEVPKFRLRTFSF
jgi:hypothetical protein